MSCSSQNYSGIEDANSVFVNWAGSNFGLVERFFVPNSLADLVQIVERASNEGKSLRVVGKRWSFEDIAYTPDWMISLDRLNRPLYTVVKTALNDRWNARQSDNSGDKLFHVESGIRVAHLNSLLASSGLALSTLGGANGQTLGGALSTGTHGADIDLPPLHDAVMAMHLVTVSGREIWVERASEPITSDLSLAFALECAEAEIIRDDALFNALLVGLGRFGVIYAYVLRVRPVFWLAEWTVEVPRVVVTALLRQGVAQGTIHAPLLTLLPDPPGGLGALDIKNPRWLEVVMDTQNLDSCRVRRRWLTNDRTDLNMLYIEDRYCREGARAVKDEAVHGFHKLASAAAGGAVAGGILSGIFSFGLGIAAAYAAGASIVGLYEGKARWLEEKYAENPAMSAGDMLALVCQALWDANLGQIIRQLASNVFRDRYRDSEGEGKRGISHLILSLDPRASDQTCFRPVSIEPVFDAWKADYLDFVDSVISLAPNFKQAGYIALRWSAKSDATLSMHNINGRNAVSVEITSLRGLPDNLTWMNLVEQLTAGLGGIFPYLPGIVFPDFGGRLHWGQINKLGEARVGMLYGDHLQAWRETLWALTGDSRLFSNSYCRQRGLEPLHNPAQSPLVGTRVDEIRAQAVSAILGLLLSESNDNTMVTIQAAVSSLLLNSSL
jgi:hypothetical protein